MSRRVSLCRFGRERNSSADPPLHRTVVERLLRGQNRGRSDDPAKFRARPPNHRHSTARHGDERHSPSCGQWPHQHLSARRRSGNRCIGAGGTRALHRRRQRLLCYRELCRRRPKGRARRCPRAPDQHLEPPGRSARGRISIDGAALRVGGRLGRRRPVPRWHGAAPGVSGPRRNVICGSTARAC